MGTTAKGIVYPDVGNTVDSLHTVFATMASSVDNVFNLYTLKTEIANQAEVDLGTTNKLVTSAANRAAVWGAYAMAAGIETQSASIAVNANRNINVTFPAGRFGVPPTVTANCENARVTIGVSSITTTGCVISMSNWSAGTMSGGYKVYWQAVQMKATDAEG